MVSARRYKSEEDVRRGIDSRSETGKRDEWTTATASRRGGGRCNSCKTCYCILFELHVNAAAAAAKTKAYCNTIQKASSNKMPDTMIRQQNDGATTTRTTYKNSSNTILLWRVYTVGVVFFSLLGFTRPTEIYAVTFSRFPISSVRRSYSINSIRMANVPEPRVLISPHTQRSANREYSSVHDGAGTRSITNIMGIVWINRIKIYCILK